MGLAGTASEPPVNPAAFQSALQLSPRTGKSERMQVRTKRRALLWTVRSAAVLVDLFVCAAFHKDLNPGTAGGTPPGPAGLPTSAIKSVRMLASELCTNPMAARGYVRHRRRLREVG